MNADEPLSFPADRYLRIARRWADMSQQELAEHARVSQSSIARMERNPRSVRADALSRVLESVGLHLIVVDDNGDEIMPEPTRLAELKNMGRRRFPPHLDVRPGAEGWWAHRYWSPLEKPAPAHTFDRARWRRDLQRRDDAREIQERLP